METEPLPVTAITLTEKDCQQVAQQHTAGISHEQSRWGLVEEPESENRSRQCQTEQDQLKLTRPPT